MVDPDVLFKGCVVGPECCAKQAPAEPVKAFPVAISDFLSRYVSGPPSTINALKQRPHIFEIDLRKECSIPSTSMQ